jgi:hypothetical protein
MYWLDAFRHALNAPEIPFIAGGLGDYLSDGRYGKYFTEYKEVNQALLRYAETSPNAYFVTARGLTANADGLHFDAVSQRKFGVPYFESFSKKKTYWRPLPTKANWSIKYRIGL